MSIRSWFRHMPAKLRRSAPTCWLHSACLDQRGNVLILTALALPTMLGLGGLAFEGANWYQTKRAMQNAADAAVVAAASNATAGYATEAKAVTAQYGFQDGVADTVVTASNSASCPSGGTGCYSVTITRKLPLMLAQVVGFQGNATVNGSQLAQQLQAVAVAAQATSPRSYCVLALASSGTSPGIRANGAPKADLTGCSVMSNTDVLCNGHDLNADYGDAHGSSSGCGNAQTANVPTTSDPYSALSSNIPKDPSACAPPVPTKKSGPDNMIAAGSKSWTLQRFCGSTQLLGDVTLTGANTVIVIENGDLDTDGYTIKTASGASATIIFTGTDDYSHAPTGGGTIDITAPTSGVWSGIAIYQDPKLTAGVDISAAGNSPTWNITGLVYLPHSSVTFSGAVNKSSNGKSCFVLVVDNLLINGTGSILSRGECSTAGLTMPTSNLPSRGKLVS
jgi:Flp pilus assembly protein TadG